MTTHDYINTVRKMMAFYGVYADIDDGQLGYMFRRGLTPDQAYGVACDMNAGFDIDDAIDANAAI